MDNGDFDAAFRREQLREIRSRRRARERSQALSLVERTAALLASIAGFVFVLAHYGHISPLGLGCGLGASVPLILRLASKSGTN